MVTAHVHLERLSVTAQRHVSLFLLVVLPLMDVVSVSLSMLEHLGACHPTLVPTSQQLVQSITTDVVTVSAHLVTPGVPINPSVSLSHLVVLPTTTVVTVSHSSQELLGVALPLHVTISRPSVLTTITVRLNNVFVTAIRPGALTTTHVSTSHHVVLLMTIVVTVSPSRLELPGVLLPMLVTTFLLSVL